MPLHPDCRQVLDVLESLGFQDLSSQTVAEARAVSLAPPPATPTPVDRVQDRTIPSVDGDIPVRIYRPGHAPTGVLVYFHGGGWVIGGLDGHDETCRRLCAQSGMAVVAVDYRLAPETRYPGAVMDCWNATAWVAEHAGELGVGPGRLAVGGDSAGGNLAAATAQMARDKGGPEIAFQLLIYPVTDDDFDRASYLDNAEGYLLSRKAMRWFWDHYAPKAEQRSEPYAAPLKGNLAGLPPALVQVAEFDPLRDEGVAYAEALKAAGVDVWLTRYDGMIHGFFGLHEAVGAAGQAMDEACAALREHLA